MTGKMVGMTALWLGMIASAPAFAGVSDQHSACRPDVRRYCHNVPAEGGDNAYLACLQAHRPRLSAACRQVLEANGV